MEVKALMKYLWFRKKNFTLIELLIVVAIIGILVSILIPSLSKARLKAKEALCISNQSQITKAMNMYTISSDDAVPSGHYGDKAYTMAIWGNIRYGAAGDGWLALGLLYQFGLEQYAVWHCPTTTDDVWTRARKDRFPANVDSSVTTLADYSLRSNVVQWSGVNSIPEFPKINSYDGSTAYIADTFAGLPSYNQRHGNQKFVITGYIDTSVKKARSQDFHRKVLTLTNWSTAKNSSIMDELWEILDEL